MKFIKERINASREDFLEMLCDNEATNKNVKFESKRGTPVMHVKQSSDKIKIKCEYVGGATKDNAFLEGTSFSGKLVEKNGELFLSGILWTAPIFHTVLFLAFAVYIALCIMGGSFTPMPLIVILFDVFMYKDEFAKQGLIERYIQRANKRSTPSVRGE